MDLPGCSAGEIELEVRQKEVAGEAGAEAAKAVFLGLRVPGKFYPLERLPPAIPLFTPVKTGFRTKLSQLVVTLAVPKTLQGPPWSKMKGFIPPSRRGRENRCSPLRRGGAPPAALQLRPAFPAPPPAAELWEPSAATSEWQCQTRRAARLPAWGVRQALLPAGNAAPIRCRAESAEGRHLRPHGKARRGAPGTLTGPGATRSETGSETEEAGRGPTEPAGARCGARRRAGEQMSPMN